MSVESGTLNGSVDDRTPLVVPNSNGRRLIYDTNVPMSRTDSQSGVSPIISESEDSITIRQPVQFNRVNNQSNHDERTQATINRYKYYNKLSAGSDSTLFMPNHVVPARFFMVIPIKTEDSKQPSIITIFSIWNTMMGTSLLTMPWAIQQAGFATGIALIVFLAGVCLYTAYRVMNSSKQMPNTPLEFTDVCHYYLGKPGLYVSITFSVISLCGAAIIYWVLMSNFLYNSVHFIYGKAMHELNDSSKYINDSSDYADVICPGGFPNDTHNSSMLGSAASDTLFSEVWNQTKTVPLFLLLVLAPIVNFKSPTFFTKFNALGTVSVLYILIFIIVKASKWGIHIDFEEGTYSYAPLFHWTFPSLTGILSLALYIHNCVMSIVRNQKNPENNGRDLSIAYICVAMTYIIIGVTFYCSFPFPKTCIEDNLLNNFTNSDELAFVARIFLFFQMTTVFPLLLYIMRIQLMDMLFGNIYPSVLHVVLMNAVVITICILFAVFMPSIGAILRFSGALCGFVYIFTLPCVVYMITCKNSNKLTAPIIVVHVTVILLGLTNFIAQFLIL